MLGKATQCGLAEAMSDALGGKSCRLSGDRNQNGERPAGDGAAILIAQEVDATCGTGLNRTRESGVQWNEDLGTGLLLHHRRLRLRAISRNVSRPAQVRRGAR